MSKKARSIDIFSNKETLRISSIVNVQGQFEALTHDSDQQKERKDPLLMNQPAVQSVFSEVLKISSGDGNWSTYIGTQAPVGAYPRRWLQNAYYKNAALRHFESRHCDIGVNVFIASGFGGQTLETLALPGKGAPFERITGFPLKPYVSASYTYYFRRR